jgi:hypothetical protein
MFLVSEIYYEYNDEIMQGINTSAGSEPATPLVLFKTREKAEADALAKTLEKINELKTEYGYDSISMYGYETDDVFNTDALDEYRVKYQNNDQIISYDEGDPESIENAFRNLLEVADPVDVPVIINNVLNIKFYKVTEVEIGD